MRVAAGVEISSDGGFALVDGAVGVFEPASPGRNSRCGPTEAE